MRNENPPPGPACEPSDEAPPTVAVSRRDFLRATSAAGLTSGVAAAGLAACKKDSPPAQGGAAAKPPGPGRDPREPRPGEPAHRLPPPQPRKTGQSAVVVVRDAAVLDERGRVRAKVLARMLDDAVVSLTGAAGADEAWKRLLRPEDVLGIKTNAWRHLATPPALENALKRQARRVGIPEARIRLDDRGARRTLADCTALINARPLRSHHWAGIGGCLKNYIMFVERPWEYHPDACADLGALWNLPVVRGKTRLNVLVMLTPLFHGRGPHHFNQKYLWPYKGLIVSADPVAADRVGLEILRAKRRAVFGEERPFATRTRHVEYADTRHGVGVADWKRLRLIRLGYAEDALLPT